MKAAAVIFAVAGLALIALTLVPEAAEFRQPLTFAALAAVLAVVIALIAGRRAAAPEPAQRPAPPVKPAPLPLVANQAEAEVISFLALLQEKGRLVDFLMDDITRYGDAEVGAAARVVHQGCRAVLAEHLRITPLRDEAEGSTVTVPAAYAADEYRLIGRVKGEAPFIGRLVHRGWRTQTVTLPRVLRRDGDTLPAIAPAEVELS